jgi:hypothetical protein
LEAGGNGLVGHLARAVVASHFVLFDSGGEFAVLQDRAGRLIEQAANSKDDHDSSVKRTKECEI